MTEGLDDAELLRQYAMEGSEEAFALLVRRYLPLVYSAALRQARGDEALAQDVAQTVFIDLAKKAGALVGRELLAGWLYGSTRLASSNARRGEQRRRLREQLAVAMQENQVQSTPDLERVELKDELDAAMGELGIEERNAVLLRFFQGKGLREVGAALGISEDAARMRVSRSLEKLHALLQHRGVPLSAVALGAALASEAVSAAPAGLAASIAGTALAHAATGTGVTLTLAKILTMTKIKLGIIGAVVLAGMAAPWVVQHETQVKLREKGEVVRRQSEQLAQLTAENERLSERVPQSNSTPSLPREQLNELLKLRAEVTQLRSEAQAIAQSKGGKSGSANDGQNNSMDLAAKQLLGKVSLLKRQLEQMPEKSIAELQLLDDHTWLRIANETSELETENGLRRGLSSLREAAKNILAGKMGQALTDFARANNGQLPADIAQLKPYFESGIDEAVLQRYQMTKSGNVSELKPDEMVVAENSPVDDQYDVMFQIGLNGSTSRGVGVLSGQRSTTTWSHQQASISTK